MQIVIDIPEKVIREEDYIGFFKCLSPKLYEVITNGKPLPKGHGDLIDKAKLLDEMFDKCGTECCCCEHFIINKKGCRDDCGLIFNAPTIIEAESEDAE